MGQMIVGNQTYTIAVMMQVYHFIYNLKL